VALESGEILCRGRGREEHQHEKEHARHAPNLRPPPPREKRRCITPA